MSGLEPDQILANALATIAIYESQCHACRAGFTLECVVGFDSEADCPEGKVAPQDYLTATVVRDALTATAAKGKRGPKGGASGGTEPGVTFGKPDVDSGYIHPDAYPFTKDIGDFTDPESTGRKAVVKMYPLEGTGMVCEWANRRVHGLPGGPILGCTGQAATDWHHGPDKNTLNNEKATWGVGTQENIHLICSACHNLAHAQIDPLYPPYDRKLQQDVPWLPLPGDWGAIVLELLTQPEDIDALLAQERRRVEAQLRSGKTTRGRGSTGQGHAESVVVEEDEMERADG